MKRLETLLASIIVKTSFVLTYFLPVQNRVAIISYFNKDYGLEFSKIKALLEEKDIVVVSDLVKFQSNLLGKFKYLFSFVKQVYFFNTCKVILVDGNSFVHARINKKQSVKVVQLWHASGAIKQFGSMVDHRRYQIKPYDVVVAPSNYFKPIYAKALDSQNVKVLGVSKTDYLFDQTYLTKLRDNFYQKYPDLLDKKIVLYAPTFRGEGIEDMNIDTNAIKVLQDKLPKDYQLILRLHPLVREQAKGFFSCDEMNLYTMLEVSDYIISDYSALVFDSMILNKKIILYLYDYQQYKQTRGLCVNIDDFGLPTVYNEQGLLKVILDYPSIDFNKVKEKYIDHLDGQSSIRISDLIQSLLKGDNV